jgi:hypothetical protein
MLPSFDDFGALLFLPGLLKLVKNYTGGGVARHDRRQMIAQGSCNESGWHKKPDREVG